MKIAISAVGYGWSERIDERFGRARGFFVCDTENSDTAYIDNLENVEAGHGAGTSSAQTVIDAGVEVVITGRVGPKAGSALRAGGVTVFLCDAAETVKDAFEGYQNGELEEADH